MIDEKTNVVRNIRRFIYLGESKSAAIEQIRGRRDTEMGEGNICC